MQSVTLSSQTYDKVRDLLGSMKSKSKSERKSCSMTCQSISEGEETRLKGDKLSQAKARLRSQARQVERMLHCWTQHKHHTGKPLGTGYQLRHCQTLDNDKLENTSYCRGKPYILMEVFYNKGTSYMSHDTRSVSEGYR